MAINLPIVVDFDGRGLKRAVAEFKKLETNAARATFIINKSAVPAAAALGGLAVAGFSAAKAAAEDAAEQALLAGQLVRTTGATQAQVAANESFIDSVSRSVAVADSELRPALSALVTGTKDLATAQRLLKVALDVSAATGANLGTVSEALSRGFNGNNRALARLSPELKTLIAEGASFADVLKVLEANFGGAAQEAANTAQGGMKKLAIAVDEAQESIGTALLPYMEQLVPLLVEGAKWFERNSKVVTIAVVAFGSIATVLLAAKLALGAYNVMAALTTAANTALATSGFAVQISTGIGIASAVAGAAALAGIAYTIKQATQANYEYAQSTAKVTEETGLMKVMIDKARDAADKKRAADAAAAKALEKAAAAAEKAKNAATQLFNNTKKALADAKQGLRDYATSLADTVRGYVSLQSAVSLSNDREQAYNDALQERLAAYAELNKLQKSGIFTYEQMAEASERVANAEAAVNKAQSGRVNYAQQFREQIAAAKTFAGQLQTLIGQGLSREGLAQLMNLGPVAGSVVAADLIAGTSGMTAASLSSDLAGLSTAGDLLGGTAIAGDMALLNQAGVGQRGNNVYVTVTSADPNAVVDALRKYMRQNGAVPIKVTNKSN
jgi:hypothetical protein